MLRKTYNLILALFVTSVFSLSACSCNHVSAILNDKTVTIEGATITRTVNVPDFNDLKVARGIKVKYTQTPGKPSVSISAAESIMPYIVAKVKDSTLRLTIDDNIRVINSGKGDIAVITVSSANLKEIEVSSAASFNTTSRLTSSELDLSASSAGTIDISGSISCNELDADAASAATIKISAVKASDISAEASSAAGIKISGIDAGKVDAEASSAAGLTLSGTAQNCELEASSGGEIEAKNLIVNSYGNADASSGAKINCNFVSGNTNASSGGSATNHAKRK